MGTLVGSHANVARMPGVTGIMLTFDDFIEGLDTFGRKLQPLMTCRAGRALAAA